MTAHFWLDLGYILIVGFVGTLGGLIAMLLFLLLASKLTGIPLWKRGG